MSTRQNAVFACKASEVAPGRQKIVTLDDMRIGIFEIDGDYHALLNRCPHRGGPLCEGPQCGTSLPTDEHEIVYGRHHELVRCAWHGWEFDIRTGQALADPRRKARTFAVSREGDDLYVHL